MKHDPVAIKKKTRHKPSQMARREKLDVGGRPRKPTFDWPIYDTLGQCCSTAGVPLSILKEAKRLGCPAFRHGRIHFGEFIPWLFTTMMTDSSVNWSEESKKLDVLLKRVDLAEKEERVIDRNTVADGIAKAVGVMFADLDRVFTSEIPTRGKGMDELPLRKLALDEIEKIKDSMRRKLELIARVKIESA